MSFSGSPQQELAVEQVLAWLSNPRGPQVFRLFGFAGTGKTTLATHLVQHVRGLVLFACFTGKAALVMRGKGCNGASTLHSLIYKVHQDQRTGEITYLFNPNSDLAHARVLVVDEVSMVNEDLGKDVLAYGTKVLVLGDPFQLPPVKGEGFFTSVDPNVMLTEIHRQAADNPIIQMSMAVRNGQELEPGGFGGSRVIDRGDLTDEDLVMADQVLVGTNRTRHRMNNKLRQLQGLQGKELAWHPAIGDRLVCLKNNRLKGLLNGGLWEVDNVEVKRSFVNAQVSSLDVPGLSKGVRFPEEFLLGEEDTLDWRKRKDHDEFTFGWALTVHKAQGSQWDNVLLLDESMAFRENARRHLYTGLTRAAERITIALP